MVLLKDVLLQERKKTNKTQKQYALTIKMSTQRYQDLESGRAIPTIKEIIHISNYINIDVDEMLKTYDMGMVKNGGTKQNIKMNLKQLRKEKGLTRKELADYMNVHVNTIYRWETNIIPNEKRIKELEKILGEKLIIKEIKEE